MTQLFGIHGKKRSGKDTVANILMNQTDITKISLADPIKQIVSASTGIILFNFYDDFEKDKRFDVPLVLNQPQVKYLINEIHDKFRLTDKQQESIINYFGSGDESLQFESIRDILQRFGTDCCRKLIDDKIWLKIFEQEILGGNSYIVPDIRFENEFHLIKENGGLMILVKRDTGLEDGHESEQMSIPESEYDIVIDNNGTLSELRENVNLWYTLKFNNYCQKQGIR